MAGFSDYLENKLLNFLFGGTAYTAPGTVYAALYIAAPTDAGGGTECTGGDYAREAIVCNVANWPAAAGGAIANGSVVNFGTASASWGTVAAWGLHDDPSAGNLLTWGTVTTSKHVDVDDAANFPVGDIDITLD